MKKFSLTLLVMMLLASVSFAQTQVKIAFGMNSSALYPDNANLKQNAELGWQMGGSWLMGDKFYVEPGIYYSNFSANLQSTDTTLLDYTSKLDMFRIPVFVGYHILGNASDSFFNLRVFGGPTASFITKVAESNTFKKDDFSKVLWGVDAGIGINVWWIFVDIGYEWGLNKVYNHDIYGTAKSKALWVNAGIRINM